MQKRCRKEKRKEYNCCSGSSGKGKKKNTKRWRSSIRKSERSFRSRLSKKLVTRSSKSG